MNVTKTETLVASGILLFSSAMAIISIVQQRNAKKPNNTAKIS